MGRLFRRARPAAAACRALRAVLLSCLLIASCPAAAVSPASGALLRDRLAVADGGLQVMKGVVVPDPQRVQAFYAEFDYAPVWTGRGRFETRARALLSVIGEAGSHGLSPDDYHFSLIERLLDVDDGPLAAGEGVDIELLLSGALLSYLNDLLYGRAWRAELQDSSFNIAERIDVVAEAASALREGKLASLVERLAPEPEAYAGLQKVLLRLRSGLNGEPAFRLVEETLHPGDERGEIVSLRRRLSFLGDLPSAADDHRGVFDPALVEAVKRFQARHGLDVDGVVGAQTRAALETPLTKRIEQVELSLERWRWLPRDPGERYVVVNIAGQELNVLEKDDTSLHMRVIVGLPFMRTPSFASEIRNVVLNPYWEVPYSIAVKEILPKLREDALYLSREHMQVLKRDSNELVNPIPIDWNAVPARDFPYRFRQKPGPDNALGRVKFLMPNPYSVYLHDTPAKTLFSRSRRCFSHGCVRLEKPLELADLLLHDEPGWSFERVEKTLETEQNYRIRLTRPMPVYLVYWTAWVDNTGTVHFREDVYGRDQRLKAALATL